MPVPLKVIALENQGQLADAYQILKQMWLDNRRDRELGLHLIFLTWYGVVEPDYLTGFPQTQEMKQELLKMFNEVHTYFEPQIHQDAEMLYVVGLIAHMHWFMIEDNVEKAKMWEERSKQYQAQYRALAPNGLDSKIFLNRGAYGDYFSQQVKEANGY